MEQTDSLLNIQMDDIAKNNLFVAGKWMRFIAIVYCIFSVFILLVGVVLIFNFKEIAAVLSNYASINPIFSYLSSQGGISIIAVLLLVSVVVLITFSICWFKVSKYSKQYFLAGNDMDLELSFKYLRTYFMLSCIIAVINLLISVIIAIYIFYTT